MKDFNIVIAHRGDTIGLWATVHSCEIELERSGFDYSYLICANGEGETERNRPKSEFVHIDTKRVLDFLNKAGKLGYARILQGSVSPPTARQLALEKADGKYLFFFDNHCLVAKDYFRRALLDFDKYNMDMLHSTTKFFAGDISTYHYILRLEKNFWAEGATSPDANNEFKPYPIAAGGHGGFAIKRDVWNEVGGYWNGFVGYGGEEMYFDLKMALLDKTNWIDPQLIHYHYAGRRGYPRHYTPDFYRNMMMCANIIGGESWLYKVYDSFEKNYPKPKSAVMYDLLMQAEAQSRKHAKELSVLRRRTLDEQLVFFREHAIAC
jgi:hypothetical protein